MWSNHSVLRFSGRILSRLSSVVSSLPRSRMASSEATVMLSSGHRMPIVGLGTTFMNDEETVEKALTAAIDIGYRHIDTAFSYFNEKFVGKALKNMLESGKITREDIFIVTKLPQNGMRPDDVEYFLKKSLASLELKYVDLYLIHSPISTKRTEKDEDVFPLEDGKLLLDTDVDLVKTWHAMEALVDKDLTNSIGLSNFNSKQIEAIVDEATIKPAVLQVECHAYLPQYELNDFCRKHEITMCAYAPLGSPAYADFARTTLGMMDYNKPKLLDDEKLKSVAKTYNKTPAQILLRYLTQRRIPVITKSVNPERLKQNLEIFDFSLDTKDMEVLKSLSNGTRYMGQDYLPGMTDHPQHPFRIPLSKLKKYVPMTARKSMKSWKMQPYGLCRNLYWKK